MRPVAFALARALNTAFFLATSIYCLLAYSPFAYQQFLKPAVISWVPDFIAIHTALFWLVFLITMLTLKAQLKLHGGSRFRRTATRGYVIVGALLGAGLVFRPVMPSIDNSPRSFVIALLALLPPVWLAVIDHVTYPAPCLRPSNQRHVLETCAVSAALVWAAYAIGAPFRLLRTPGVELPPSSLAIATASSAVVHAFAFMAIFLALARWRRWRRSRRPAGGPGRSSTGC